MRLVLVADPGREEDDALADLVERRLDLGARGGPGPRGTPWLATLRSVAEGGEFRGGPAEAAERLAACDGAALLDAERDVVPLLVARTRGRIPILAALHGRRPLDLPSEGVVAWKVARPVERPDDVRSVLLEAQALARGTVEGRHPPAFVVPYGPLGVALRVLTASLAEGAGVDPLVYGLARDVAPGFAAGLPSVPRLDLLLDELRLGEVSGAATILGLVGRPASRSPSPRLHAAASRRAGRDAVYAPEVDLPPKVAFALPWRGFSVTTPSKEAAAVACDALDPLAARVGAVNTVVRTADGRLVGSNTDADATGLLVAQALGARREGGTAVVLGGGGYARAAIVALRERGFDVRVHGRGRAEATARALHASFGGAAAEALCDERVVVNATPVGADGTLPPDLAAFVDALPAGTIVVDAPYAPGGRAGAFAVRARARGLVTVDGGDLLVGQAALQAAAFGARAEETPLRCALGALPPLVLVGPRGAGKTTVGRLVAAAAGLPFTDTDETIARRAGRPAGRVLERLGERAFRAEEAKAVRAALARRGVVVALGGGALEDPASRALAAERGFVVRLDAAPEVCAARIVADRAPRPRLAPGLDLVEECRRLAAARAAGWSVARAGFDTTRTPPAEVAARVLAAWVADRPAP